MAIEGLSARLHLDHHVDPELARELRPLGYDVTIPAEIGMERAPDEDHLQYAAAHGRVLLTSDLRDFPRLADAWFEQGRAHAGIVFMLPPPRLPYGEMRRRLLALLETVSAEDLQNQVLWLDARWSPGDAP